MKKATTVKGFEWNAETVSKATELYQALIADQGVETANTNDELGKIAKEIGAKSAQAVRSKLANEKVYEKADKPRSVAGTVRTQKAHYIKALVKAGKKLGVDMAGTRELASLEQGVAADLKLVVSMLEAATGESIPVNPQAATVEAKVPKQETAKA